jgi:hypothetical protein
VLTIADKEELQGEFERKLCQATQRAVNEHRVPDDLPARLDFLLADMAERNRQRGRYFDKSALADPLMNFLSVVFKTLNGLADTGVELRARIYFAAFAAWIKAPPTRDDTNPFMIACQLMVDHQTIPEGLLVSLPLIAPWLLPLASSDERLQELLRMKLATLYDPDIVQFVTDRGLQQGIPYAQTFVQTYGHVIPDSNYVETDGYQLGRWFQAWALMAGHDFIFDQQEREIISARITLKELRETPYVVPFALSDAATYLPRPSFIARELRVLPAVNLSPGDHSRISTAVENKFGFDPGTAAMLVHKMAEHLDIKGPEDDDLAL